MRRGVGNYLLIITSLLLIVFIFQKINWLPSFSNVFKSKPLIIDETPVLIKDIRILSQIVTISMYDEVVMSFSKPKNLPSFPGLRPVHDKIVLIGKGKVLAGVDLKKIKVNKLAANKDTVIISIPPAEILSTIMNPSDFETFDEVGKWKPAQVTQLKKRLRDKITSRALQNQILPKAYERCKVVLENFLRALGYKNIFFT
jgi:hypothetical protein